MANLASTLSVFELKTAIIRFFSDSSDHAAVLDALECKIGGAEFVLFCDSVA